MAIQVNFDAAGVERGDYAAEIVALSNNPVTLSASIPVAMTVVEPHREEYLWS